jgi:hypothetical protein
MPEIPDRYGCEEDEICIDIGGDVTPTARVGHSDRFDNFIKEAAKRLGLSQKEAYNYPWRYVEELFEESLTIVNFESATHDSPHVDKDEEEELRAKKTRYAEDESRFDNFLFGASETGVESVGPEHSSIEAVSLANNHALDFGAKALEGTMKMLAAVGLTVFGAGEDTDEAFSPRIEEYKGKKIALIGVSTVVGSHDAQGARTGDPDAPLQSEVTKGGPAAVAAYEHTPEGIAKHKEFVAKAIKQAKDAGADIVIVYYHWGEEYSETPTDYQVELGRYAADQGADIVAGAHQHAIQGVEEYQTRDGSRVVPIAYGLGNLMFAGNINPKEEASKSIVFRMRYKENEDGELEPVGYTIIPIDKKKGDYSPRIAEGERAEGIVALTEDRAPTPAPAPEPQRPIGPLMTKKGLTDAAKRLLDLAGMRGDRTYKQPEDRDGNPIYSPSQVGQMELQEEQDKQKEEEEGKS